MDNSCPIQCSIPQSAPGIIRQLVLAHVSGILSVNPSLLDCALEAPDFIASVLHLLVSVEFVGPKCPAKFALEHGNLAHSEGLCVVVPPRIVVTCCQIIALAPVHKLVSVASRPLQKWYAIVNRERPLAGIRRERDAGFVSQ